MDGYKRLNPKSKIAMYARNAIILAAVAAIAVILIFACIDEGITPYRPIVIGVLAGICAAYLLIGPLVYYSFYRYQVNAERVDVRYGILFRKRIVVPIERIHQIEIRKGPIKNMLGLANVAIMTAGGIGTIHYLEQEEADAIADDLNAVVNRIIRDRQ